MGERSRLPPDTVGRTGIPGAAPSVIVIPFAAATPQPAFAPLTSVQPWTLEAASAPGDPPAV